MIWALMCGLAWAEGASTLPAGSTAGWLAAGFGTFRHIRHADGFVQPLDRALHGRVEGWWGAGLTDRLELSASLPLVANGVAIIDGSPCVSGKPTPDYCDPVVGLGRATLGLKARRRVGEVDLALSVVGATDAWLADRRGRWTSTSDATWDLRLAGLAGGSLGPVRVDGWLGFTGRTKRDLVVDQEVLRVPANQVDAGVQVAWRPGDWGLQGTVDTIHRLGGLQRDATWVSWARDSEERFAALQYRDVSVALLGSRALRDGWTAHLGLRRVVWVRNGPPDRWDAVVGVSRWVAGPGGG